MNDSAKQIGFFIYDGMDILDLTTVYQVFTSVNRIRPGTIDVFTFAFRIQPIICNGGMILTPECGLTDVTQIDILVIPGGEGRRVPMANPMIQDGIQRLSDQCEYVIGISSGSIILASADVLRQRQVTTHWLAIKELQQREGVIPYHGKIVRSGRVITCAGGSLGIEVALHVVAEIFGDHFASEVRNLIEHRHTEIPISKF